MKHGITTGAALLLSTSIASAGGLDRSGQIVTPIFEDGSYAELSFGYVMPEVSGSGNFGAVLESGNIGVDYLQFGFAYKTDLNEQLSVAIIYDQPYGANIDYADPDAGYPFSGTNADFRSHSLTALLRYKMDDNLSFHGGIRGTSIDADLNVITPSAEYDASFASDTAFAYVIGAAYEIPDIALRVALTYSSETEYSHDADVRVSPIGTGPDTVSYTMPQSVNLDFQTGIASDTLLFGSARWVEWTATSIEAPNYFANPVISYDDDVVTYNVGVGRRFSDAFSGSASVGYEKANGGIATNLAPTDGFTSVSIGGQYTLDNGVEISGGVRYVMIGDAESNAGVPVDWTDNSALGLGLKVAYNY